MRKLLTKVGKVSPEQVEFGKRIGLDLNGCTVNVAIARIQDAIDQLFWGKSLGQPTAKQVALADKFGYDLRGETRRVAHAIIDDLMLQLNREAIEEHDLKPGAKIRHVQNGNEYVISSVQDDGMVFFKGGNGKKAWARNLVGVE